MTQRSTVLRVIVVVVVVVVVPLLLEDPTLTPPARPGRSDDNVESLKQRFDTFKAETLPMVELFRRRNKCVEIDTSQPRQTVFNLLRDNLAEFTDENFAAQPLTEKAEMMLGLRPWPKDKI